MPYRGSSGQWSQTSSKKPIIGQLDPGSASNYGDRLVVQLGLDDQACALGGLDASSAHLSAFIDLSIQGPYERYSCPRQHPSVVANVDHAGVC